MGREFGNLARVRHVISYSLSPFEQRAFPHFLSKGIPNVLRRSRASVLRVVPRECAGRGAGRAGACPELPRVAPTDLLVGLGWPEVT